jgi:RES domain-containing protein
MKIWRICRACYAAEAFSGDGARRFGGRWNSRGTPMVYASTSLALAAMELFVHLEPSQAPDDLVYLSAVLPDGEPALRWDEPALPPNWWGDELGPVRALGDAWVRGGQSLAVLVPSVPIRPEWNVLVNPLHPSLSQLRPSGPTPFHFDARIFSTG